MPVFPPSDPIPPGAPGSLITTNYQYEFNGVLMGALTPFTVEKITGLLGNAPVRLKDIDRENGHGSIPGSALFSPRTVSFDIKASDQFDGTPVDDLLDMLSHAFDVPQLRYSTDLDVFAYQRPGRSTRRIFARGTKFDVDSTFNVGRGLIEASVEFVAPDPISYDLDLSTQSLTLGVGVTSNSMIVTMAGNFRNGTSPFLYISGACTDPIISNQDDDNRQIKLDVVLAANQICRLNMDTLEVSVQTGGGSNPWIEDYSIVRDDSQFWNLMPGNNTIVYARTGSGASSTLRVDWYNAWARG
jgi:hypothetical protein